MKKFLLFLMLCAVGMAAVYYLTAPKMAPESATAPAPVPEAVPVGEKLPEPKPVPGPEAEPAPVVDGSGVRPGYTLIASLDELADYAAKSGNQIRMKPGTYAVKKTYYTEDPRKGKRGQGKGVKKGSKKGSGRLIRHFY